MADEQVTLTIDDMTVTVPKGTTIFEAARSVGIDIPHLCYDPELGLPPTSSCRLCLVELDGAKAPVASCSHPVSEGMVVRTDTQRLREMRRLVIDLLLSDHPADCLTCDRSGRCALQKYAYEMGVKAPEYAGEPVKPVPVPDGPAITYDRTKCILCGRCVSVCQDVQVTAAIDYMGRGYQTRPDLPPGLTREESVCVECGNCIDVCPTGALAFSGALGAGRAWEMQQTITTCPYCGVGCTMVLHTRGNRIVQVTGEPGLGVNRGLLCVKGRFGFDFVHHPDRLREPLVRRGGELVCASWEEALSTVAERLSEIKKRFGPDAVGGLLSARCTNEENY
ncbi:MAG: 2Fe-2S iron-sulfur cluster-binding protein, partial [Armatimonadota bacterium]